MAIGSVIAGRLVVALVARKPSLANVVVTKNEEANIRDCRDPVGG
jgi:hypothetical protein